MAQPNERFVGEVVRCQLGRLNFLLIFMPSQLLCNAFHFVQSEPMSCPESYASSHVVDPSTVAEPPSHTRWSLVSSCTG